MWRILPTKVKEGWNKRAVRLNQRLILEQFRRIPYLYLRNVSPDKLHCILLQADFRSFQCAFNK